MHPAAAATTVKSEIPFLKMVQRTRIGKECPSFHRSLELLFPPVPSNGLCEQKQVFLANSSKV
jgi:hypothetical protein